MRKYLLIVFSTLLFSLACNNHSTSADNTPQPSSSSQSSPNISAADATASEFQSYIPIVTLPGNSYYVAPDGKNTKEYGTRENPWRTIEYAVKKVPDGSTILVAPGTYNQQVRLEAKFERGITIRAQVPYQSRLRYNEKVIICFTCAGITMEGFDVAHDGPGADWYVIQIQDIDDNGKGGRDLKFINNVFHDSYNNDIIKVNNGAQNILFENNIFYNQSGSDSHIDINSVKNVTLKNNVFFNDFSGSGRSDNNTGSFIVIKDSNAGEDDIYGSQHITLDGNVFVNWQGKVGNSFIALGDNSDADYYYAKDILIENNLFIGNSDDLIHTTLKVVNSKDVIFRNNTVTGDMPASTSFAFRLTTGALKNKNIQFYNNIWSDPTGTMGAEDDDSSNSFAKAEKTEGITLLNNLYWNGGKDIPEDKDELVTYKDDSAAVFGDPHLYEDQSTLKVPRWFSDQSRFNGGAITIRDVFLELVHTYGIISADSAAIDQANPEHAPSIDIFGRNRDNNPDIGAYEYNPYTQD